MLASRNGKAGNDGSDSGTAQISGYRDIMKAKRFSNTLLKTTLSPMCIDQHILNRRGVSTGEDRGTLYQEAKHQFHSLQPLSYAISKHEQAVQEARELSIASSRAPKASN